MGHYSDYYEQEDHKKRMLRKQELDRALTELEKLMFWDYERKYILPDSIRSELRATVIKSIKAELFDLENNR